ncbi:TonB-dependent receptor [Sphingomonas bacterium]|uniref:TonB-dependent receptor n=1 Tax=Sphingomonas bacterium TaxID=1895847 RepID=UPI0015764945|nr:TonB-dependent receptor [Sphingomonas bacterium]
MMGSAAAASDAADDASKEIVVTGTKIDLKPTVQSTASFIAATPLDTPATISVVPSTLIVDRGITGLDDVLRNIPGVQVAQGETSGRAAGEDAVSRGFPINTSGVFRDGLREFTYANVPVELYDRIELLKGLTALQAGFIGPAGILNLITKRPQPDDAVHADAQVTNFGGVRLVGDVNFADISAGISVRVVGVYENLANYIRGFGGRRLSALVAVRVPLGETTTLDLDASHTDQQSDYQTPLYYFNGNPTALPNADPRTFLGQHYSGYPIRATSASARLTHEFGGGWKLVAGGQGQSFSRFTNRCGQASLNDPDPVTGDAGYDIGCEPNNSPNRDSDRNLPFYNAEVRLTGGFTLFGMKHDVAVGYQYSYFQYRPASGNFFYTAIDTAGAGIFTQNVFTPRTYAIPTLYEREPRTSFNGHYEVTDQGVYAQDRIDLFDGVQLWLGGRYVNYDSPNFNRPVTSVGDGIAIVDANNRVVSGDGSTVFGDFVKDDANSYTVSTFTPAAAIVWKPAATVSLYGSYSQALEQGGTAPDTAANAGQLFPPLRSTTYELGAKWDIGKALLTAALFHIDKPLQVTNSRNIFTQDGTQRHEGIEVSASGQIAPNLTAVAGLLLLHAKQVNVSDPTLEGKRPPGVAGVVANAYLEYAAPWLPGLVLSAGDYHVGNQYLFGDGVFKVGAYDRIDAGARFVFAVRHARVTTRLNVINFANTRYNTVDANGGGDVIAGAPRTFRLSAGVDF